MKRLTVEYPGVPIGEELELSEDGSHYRPVNYPDILRISVDHVEKVSQDDAVDQVDPVAQAIADAVQNIKGLSDAQKQEVIDTVVVAAKEASDAVAVDSKTADVVQPESK